jgi:hypothetical protein
LATLILNATTPQFSPLEPVFAPYADQVPLAFREQFLYSADYPYGMTLDGEMHHIWHRPRWLMPLYWLLGKMGILVPHNADHIPTTLVVVPGIDANGLPFHKWCRTLQFKKPITFNTTIVYDPKLKEVVDLVGPKDILYMVWRARFHPPRTFTLDTEACALRFGQKHLWLPRWLWKFTLGTVRFIQEVDEAHDDTVHIDLLITQPLFGKIFGYTGTFRTTRTPLKTIQPA